ncbi:MAG: hypothetical protein P8181_11870 [bacterium]
MRQALIVVVILVLVPVVAAFGKSRYLSTFNGLYNTTDGTLDTCGLCHVNGYDRNDYGADFETKHNQLGDETQAFRAIEGMDSDSDSYTNIVEIDAGTFPGNDLSSLPAESSTWGKIKALYE